MTEPEYKIAHRDDISFTGVIEWSKPMSHDVLFSQQDVDEDERGYFYTICAYSEGKWWTYYIGMVYDQWVTDRHKQKDHKNRLDDLKIKHPSLIFHVSIGVLKQASGARITEELIADLEGLLIHAEWHEELANKRKVGTFSSGRTYSVTNDGFIDHLDAKEIVFAVVYREK